MPGFIFNPPPNRAVEALPEPVRKITDTLLPPNDPTAGIFPPVSGIAVATSPKVAPPAIKALVDMLRKPADIIDPLKRLALEKINSRPPSPKAINIPEGFNLPTSTPNVPKQEPILQELLGRWRKFDAPDPLSIYRERGSKGQWTPRPSYKASFSMDDAVQAAKNNPPPTNTRPPLSGRWMTRGRFVAGQKRHLDANVRRIVKKDDD